ncbi:hypothetical protein [uncultured Pseudoflavonifractor sp.]|uniref:hypothetical protein n=1 Tax=uncultured Pseudoflavonifractor sp. TaxID=1221379 RepID=UPI0025EE60D0|nr:hypothetical protein [uncultured Pseudoflavonifractor sp.]
MLDREDLQAIAQLISESESRTQSLIGEQLRTIHEDITNMKQDMAEMKQDIADLKESVQEVRDSTNYIADWVEGLESAFNKHKAKPTH